VKARAWCSSAGTRSPRRHTRKTLSDYQSGQRFDRELIEQVDILPDFVPARGLPGAKRRVTRRKILTAAVAALQ
jgi:hypothetical protein